jgi:uncharacterized protein (TIGR00369 family)
MGRGLVKLLALVILNSFPVKTSHKLIQWTSHLSPRIMCEIIRRQIGRTVPFAKLLGITIDAMETGKAQSRVVELPQLNNHVGTFHAGVLFTLCESASGAALTSTILPVIMQTRFVVRDAKITYLKSASAEISATATVVGESRAVLEYLRKNGSVDVEIDVRACTAAQVIVAKATFNWNLKLMTAEGRMP